MSPRTEAAYVYWIKRFVRFCGPRHPAELGMHQVQRFLSGSQPFLFTRLHMPGSKRQGLATRLRSAPALDAYVCVKKLEFAARLPDGTLAAQRAQRGLALPDSTWEQAALLDRRMAVIRSWGWPNLIVRVIERSSRRRAA
jgi:hypothetical protein